MSKENPYLGLNGKVLKTPAGEVITQKDVAMEVFSHSLNNEGKVVLPTEGNYFLTVDFTDPSTSEWFATYGMKDGKRVPGGPDDPRKINSVKMWRDPNPAKSQLIFEENDLNNEKGTVGEVSPLVAQTNTGDFVAVQDAVRFGLKYVEAWRRGWSRPVSEGPQVNPADEIEIVRYTDEDLGLINANNARLVAPDGQKAFVSSGLTVLKVGNRELPEVPNTKWIPIEEVVTFTEELMGKAAILAGIVFGYLRKDPEKLKNYLDKLPAHVQGLKDQVKSI